MNGTPGHREGGAILIVTLLFLVVLTMLGVTAMTGTTMEERMAGNTRDASLALQAAESALRDARRDISRIPVTGSHGRAQPPVLSDFGSPGGPGGVAQPGTCNASLPGLCSPLNNPDGSAYNRTPGAVLPSVPAHNLLAAPSVQFGQMTGATPVGGTVAGTTLSNQPRYVLELFCLQEKGSSFGQPAQTFCNFYRITARGYGKNPNTQVTLQEVFVSL